VLLKVHGGLVLRDDDTDFLTGAEFLEFGGHWGKVAVPGQDKGSIKFVCYGIGKQGYGDVDVGFLLLVGLVAALTERAFTVTKVKFAQNVLYPHSSEGVNIEQVFFGPGGYPGSQGRKVVNGGNFLGFGINKPSGKFPKVEPATIGMGVLKGAVIEVKAVYVDAYSGFRHKGRFLRAVSDSRPCNKKNARHTARRGQASIVLAGTFIYYGKFGLNVKRNFREILSTGV